MLFVYDKEAMAFDTAHFKEKLLAEKSVLEEELRSLGVRNPDNPKDWEAGDVHFDIMEADRNEAADRSEEFTENRAMLDELEVRYNHVMKALKKITTGAYGICEVCGEEIERERLEANAAARTCKTHMDQEESLPR